jgi:hypothetical protein
MTTVSPRCAHCGFANPDDARFCIACGQSLVPAATGATTRLAGTPCPACRTVNPEDAHFCVICGRGLVSGTPRQQPSGHARRPAAHAPRAAAPRVAPHPQPWRAGTHQRHGRQPNTAAIFLAGLVFLLMTGVIWPGILLLIGVVKYVEASSAGRQRHGLQALLWLGGLTILFATHTFWPGIVVLALLSWTLNR